MKGVAGATGVDMGTPKAGGYRAERLERLKKKEARRRGDQDYVKEQERIEKEAKARENEQNLRRAIAAHDMAAASTTLDDMAPDEIKDLPPDVLSADVIAYHLSPNALAAIQRAGKIKEGDRAKIASILSIRRTTEPALDDYLNGSAGQLWL
jgi:hypothetical protein